MCGICGVFYADPCRPVDRALLEGMSALIPWTLSPNPHASFQTQYPWVQPAARSTDFNRSGRLPWFSAAHC